MHIDDWGDKGKGIGRYGRLVVLTDRGLPGDTVRARIVDRRRRHLVAEVEEIVQPSPDRVEPRCKHFGICGGCRLQDLAYARQVETKVRHLREQIRRIGKIETVPDIEVIPFEPPFRYRNKMEFSFGGESGKRLTLGLHPRNNYRDAFALEECWIADERAAQVVSALREHFASGDEEPYDPVEHTGFLRFVVVRVGVHTDDVLVNLVTADRPWPRANEFGPTLQEHCPFVTTALWTVNDSRANIATGEQRTVWFGPGVLHDRLGPYEFEIAPTGFFQTNTRQAEKLFETAVRWAAPSGDEDVLDLYCGVGSISLFLSQRARHVVGVELHAESVAAAKRNAERNHVDNCEFIAADALDYLRERTLDGGALPNVVIDPPRAGLHPKAVKTLCRCGPPTITYVSCNPGNLARDLELMKGVYRLNRLAAVDMFPHTPHIEAVAHLIRVETRDET
ncbi:MAG: 23S rRNA (uracil(1939)-C(5))-methyltransferase RlmD [Candidatus Zixiibacteriota bacterium]